MRGLKHRESGYPRDRAQSGMTLIEVVVATALTALMCTGLLAVGIKTQRFGEHTRVATEARALAKQRLEEMVAVGRADLALETCVLRGSNSFQSVIGGTIERRPRLVWHGADKAVVGASTSAYVEAHVDVVFYSALVDDMVTNTYSLIIQ